MARPVPLLPAFLDRIIPFPSGASYEILDPITALRSCHDSAPAEARLVATCRQLDTRRSAEILIMKIKVQYSVVPKAQS